MKRVLILIDIQNVYFEEGSYQLFQPEVAAEKALEALTIFREGKEPIIHVGHKFYKDDLSAAADHAREFHELVKPMEGEYVVWKERPSSFYGTDLAKILETLEPDQIVIAGMMSHMCIDTTVRACQDYNYPVILLEDGCTTKDLEIFGEKIEASVVHKSFMAALNGMFAKVVKVDDWSHKCL